MALSTFLLTTFLQVIQAGILLKSTLTIRKLIKDKGFSRMISVKAFAVHVIVFTGYVVMLIINTIVFIDTVNDDSCKN